MTADPAPLIVTLELAEPAQSWLQNLRDRHFPPARNLVPAHVTLFHALPPDREACLRERLAALAGPAPEVRIDAPFPLGHGVAYRLHAPQLAGLREHLVEGWRERLTRQDRAPFRPHVTIQNRVESQVARALLAELGAAHVPVMTTGAGLCLWRYLGGPWQALTRAAFEPG